MHFEKKAWSQEELLSVFRLYCRLPFGRLHRRNPEIIGLAGLIGRTPSAVAMKACNFASLDPQQQSRKIKALGNVSRADRELWKAFLIDSETVAHQAEAAYVAMGGKEHDVYLPELGQLGAPLEQTIQQNANTYGEELKLPKGLTESETLIKVRRVQSFFRNAVLASYEYRCALTGLAIPELLNAGHIIPWSVDEKRRADPRNGICLNVLHDRAFDRGLITFDEYFCVVISSAISKFEDNSIQRDQLIGIAGRSLCLPTRFQPDASAFEYHRKHIFRQI